MSRDQVLEQATDAYAQGMALRLCSYPLDVHRAKAMLLDFLRHEPVDAVHATPCSGCGDAVGFSAKEMYAP